MTRGIMRDMEALVTGNPSGLRYVVSTADVDALITNIASSLSTQTLQGSALNGVVGGTTFYPARKMTVTFSAHADWDATTAVLTYLDEDGERVTENIAIPDGGNATVTSTGYATKFISLYIPAQSGVGGTATAGLAAVSISSSADTVIDLSAFVGRYVSIKFACVTWPDASAGDKSAYFGWAPAATGYTLDTANGVAPVCSDSTAPAAQVPDEPDPATLSVHRVVPAAFPYLLVRSADGANLLQSVTVKVTSQKVARYV